jgi:hypothetical protein
MTWGERRGAAIFTVPRSSQENRIAEVSQRNEGLADARLLPEILNECNRLISTITQTKRRKLSPSVSPSGLATTSAA